MINSMSYKGYTASMVFDAEDKIIVGRVQDVDDIISFHGESVAEFESNFHAAIEDYLAASKELGLGSGKASQRQSDVAHRSRGSRRRSQGCREEWHEPQQVGRRCTRQGSEEGAHTCYSAQRRLTTRSSGAPTACHAGHQALGLRPILRLLSSAPCRWRPLSSNVRPAQTRFCARSDPEEPEPPTLPRRPHMHATELQSSVTRRSGQLAVAGRQYLDGEADAKSVQTLEDEILTEAESDERWKLPVAHGEDALWSLVWSPQHLCGPNHPLVVARQGLEPSLQAIEHGSPLPAGVSAGRPRDA